MSALSDAKKLLAPLEDRLPLRLNSMTDPKVDPQIATLRDNDGYPLLSPHAESQSMLTAPPYVFAFYEKAPAVIQALIDVVESYEANNKPQTEGNPA